MQETQRDLKNKPSLQPLEDRSIGNAFENSQKQERCEGTIDIGIEYLRSLEKQVSEGKKK